MYVKEDALTHQEASAVVSMSLRTVDKRLRNVEDWSHFLVDVEEVTATSYERYVFRVREGRQLREVAMAVVNHPREHRFTWRALTGPRYDGELRLQSVDERHTRLTLSLTTQPAGFLAGLTEMLGSTGSTAVVDLQRLESHLTDAGAA